MVDNSMVVLQGDVFSTKIGEDSVDLVITSPPRVVLENNLDELFRWVEKCLSPDGIFVLERPGLYNVAAQAVNRLVIDLVEGRVESELRSRYFIPIYHLYKESDFHTYFVLSRRELEPILGPILYRKYNEREMAHPCEFDGKFIGDLITRLSEPNDVVLDPFCGTGTVPKTAYKLGRSGIGIDRRCPFTNEL